MKSVYKKTFQIIVYIFALFGFGLAFAYLAIIKQWTNESGADDFNNRKFEEVSLDTSSQNDSAKKTISPNTAAFIMYKLMVINKHYPQNAQTIMNALSQNGDFALAAKMIEALNIKIADSNNLSAEYNQNQALFNNYQSGNTNKNAYEWIPLIEWQTLKEAIKKDKNAIDSAGKACGVEPRLIATVLIGEQIRLFKSDREVFKKALLPLKILSVENNLSYGVTGIKDFTAKDVEAHLKDPSSPYYLGKKYENLIVFTSGNPDAERMANLVNYKNHYFSYLYAGLILRQIREQWKNAGFDISERPEILATLYNVGFPSSKPKSNPVVGGSHVSVGGKDYTFGGFGFEFYYSGELSDIFPYEKEKWKNN